MNKPDDKKTRDLNKVGNLIKNEYTFILTIISVIIGSYMFIDNVSDKYDVLEQIHMTEINYLKNDISTLELQNKELNIALGKVINELENLKIELRNSNTIR